MIRNIVFDLGGVLVDFVPLSFLRSFGFEEATVQALYAVIFGAEWQRFDRGDYPDVGALREALQEKYPPYAALLERVLQPEWVKMHCLHEDTAAYLCTLRDRGYEVYILSNLSAESYAYVSRYDFFRRISGGVYSYRERLIKPDVRIYRRLLERYRLNAAETVFIDDLADNIAAAERTGMRGIRFTDFAAVRAQLEEMLRGT